MLFFPLLKTSYWLCLPILWLLPPSSAGLRIQIQAFYWIFRVSMLENIENIICTIPTIVNGLDKLASRRYFSLLSPNPHSFIETVAQDSFILASFTVEVNPLQLLILGSRPVSRLVSLSLTSGSFSPYCPTGIKILSVHC